MKTKEYFLPLLKWWWLLLLAAIAGGVSAFYTTRPLPSVYLARTTLVIGNSIYNLNPTQDEIYMGLQLAQTYAGVAMREPVRNATMAALGLTDLPPYEARAMATSPFLEISVTYSDPELAAVVANELASQLILLSPSSVEESEQQTLLFIQQQMKDIEGKIKRTQDEIVTKQEQLSLLTSAVQISQAQAELDALDARLTSFQRIYADMQTSMPGRARNALSVYEEAVKPRLPIGPNKPLIIGLAALAGIILAGGAAYGIEALDSSVKSSDEADRILNLPVLGRISDVNNVKGNRFLLSSDQPHSPIAEDFRLLRTNLEFFGVDTPLQTFMISSADGGDGKSTIAANLAQVIAMGEKNVILVDADFRKPMIATAFEISESAEGLSDVLSHSLDLADVLIPWERNPMLSILPCGTVPPNPAELLNSHKMEKLLAELKSMADIVILDAPPFIVADASVLASKMDAVVLVVRPGTTHRSAMISMREQIKRYGGRVLGMVLNQERPHSGYYASQYKKKSKQKASTSEPEVTPGD